MSNYSRVSLFPPLKCLWQQRSVSSRRQRVLPRTQSNESRWSSASSKGTPLNRIFQCGELQAICATCSQKEVKEHQPTDEHAASASWTASYRLALLVYAANLREPCAKSLG